MPTADAVALFRPASLQKEQIGKDGPGRLFLAPSVSAFSVLVTYELACVVRLGPYGSLQTRAVGARPVLRPAARRCTRERDCRTRSCRSILLPKEPGEQGEKKMKRASVFAIVFLVLVIFSGYTLIGNVGLIMCLTSLLFETMPIPPMGGKGIYDWNKIVWLALFTISAVFYMVALIFL